MYKTKIFSVTIFLLACLAFLTSCSKEPAPQQTQQTAPPPQQPAQQAAAPATQPPQPSAAAPATAPPSVKVAGAATTEQYRLYISNYAKTLITASVNGEWLGQWDSDNDLPLEYVVQGKNQLTVELQGEPKNTLNVSIYTKRGGQNVTIWKVDFNGKTGTHNFTFVAK